MVRGMIRRQVGEQFVLVTQNDHAILAGQLARHYGNGRFLRADPLEETIRAVVLHDCGWPLHDQEPTLNKDGLPLHVFETPLEVATRVWEESCQRAEGQGEPDYTQLLISLHVLGLSAYAATHKHSRPEEFELNKFQHRQIERQEELRRRLGMATDVPLRLGLAVPTNIPREEQLRRNHLILQAMDRLSLALCCTEPPFTKIENILPKWGAAPVTLRFKHIGGTTVKVEPWPFDQLTISLSVPARAIPARRYKLDEFRAAFQAAQPEQLLLTIHA